MLISRTEVPAKIVDSVGEPLDAHGETLFLRRILFALRNRMCDDFDRFTFVVHRPVFDEFAGKSIKLDPGGLNRVLIVTADEREVFPIDTFSSYHAFLLKLQDVL